MLMNLKALKFWSLKTKYKVFIHCIQRNVENSQLKRQRALQAYMFHSDTVQNNRVKWTYETLKWYNECRKEKKKKISRSVRHFNLSTMAKSLQGLRSWKAVYEHIRLIKVEKDMKANYYRSKMNKDLINRTFYAMVSTLRESRAAALQHRHSSTIAITAPLLRVQLRQAFALIRHRSEFVSSISSEWRDQKVLERVFSAIQGEKGRKLWERRLIKFMRREVEKKRQREEIVAEMERKCELRMKSKAWHSLLEFKQIVGAQDAKLQNMAMILEREKARRVFQQIQRFAILIHFGSSERLTDKLLKLQYMKKWLAYSSQDRKMLKLMSKAIKHHTRKQKSKIWKAWLAHGLNTPIYQRYSEKLQRLALHSLKRYLVRRRVKKIKERKWTEFRRYRIAINGLKRLREAARIAKPLNRIKYERQAIVESFRSRQGMRKGIESLKKYCYRCRVSKYLIAKNRHVLITRYFETMKERAIAIQSETFQLRQVDSHRVRTLLVKSFSTLKNFTIYKAYKKQNLQKALQFERFRKINLCFSLLKFYSEHRRMKQSLYSRALMARNQKKGCVFRSQEELEVQKGLVGVMQVGMYWAGVKGRFGHGSTPANASRSGAQRRIYLAVKYGNRWLNHVKLKKCEKATPTMMIGYMQGIEMKRPTIGQNQLNTIQMQKLRALLKINEPKPQPHFDTLMAISQSPKSVQSLPDPVQTGMQSLNQSMKMNMMQARMKQLSQQLNQFKSQKANLKLMQERYT